MAIIYIVYIIMTACFTQPLYNAAPPGLVNIGNTCYMNGALQAMYAIIPLTQFLINNRGLYQPASIANAYINLIDIMRKAGPQQIIDPIDFFNRIIDEVIRRELGDNWKSGKTDKQIIAERTRQRDATELLRVLFEELTSNSIRLSVLMNVIPKQANAIEQQARDAKTETEYNALPTAYKNTHYPFPFHLLPKTSVSEMFKITQTSVLSIMCEDPISKKTRKSDTHELAFSLEIPINKEDPSLKGCLRKYLEEETISGQVCQPNENCLALTQEGGCVATKALTINELSTILILGLKRFEITKEGYSNKITNPVTIPLRFATREYFNNNALVDAEYSLIGVVIHIGGITGGHYTAYVKDLATNTWYYANDTLVTPETIDRITLLETIGYIDYAGNTPYALIYQTTAVPVPPPPVAAATITSSLAQLQITLQQLKGIL